MHYPWRLALGNIQKIADELGLSTATISNALSGKGRVSAENVQRIRARAQEINYFPNPIARALKTGRSNIIGLVMPDLTQPLFPIFARSIENAAAQSGLGVLIADSMDNPDAQHEAIDRLVRRGVDGLIIIPQRGSSFAKANVPMAVIHTASHPQNTASANHYQGGQLAAATLLDAGHRKILLVGFDPLSEVQQDRIAGMVSQLSGRADYEVVWFSSMAEPDLKAFLRHHGAVIATSDTLAMQIMNLAHASGLSVPDELSIIGFDDLPFSQHLRPALTTVRANMPAIARHAVRYLASFFEDKAASVTAESFEMVLVPRDSVARPASLSSSKAISRSSTTPKSQPNRKENR